MPLTTEIHLGNCLVCKEVEESLSNGRHPTAPALIQPIIFYLQVSLWPILALPQLSGQNPTEQCPYPGSCDPEFLAGRWKLVGHRSGLTLQSEDETEPQQFTVTNAREEQV